MAEDAQTLPVYEIPYLRLFPWLRLFRAVGAAAAPKRLMLAVLGLLLLEGGWGGLDRLFVGSDRVTPPVLRTWEPVAAWGVEPATLLGRLSEPPRAIMTPFVRLFQPVSDLRVYAHAALAALWVVVVWGLVGGAIARTAALDETRGDRLEMWRALRFAIRHTPALVVTPLLPMIGVVVLAGGLALFGLLYRIPGPVAPTAAGVLAFLPLLGGVLLSLLVLGLAAGWPLMNTAVAVEAEDGFEGMSRAFAYGRQRPWHYAWLVVVSALAGCAGLLAADLFARLVVWLTAWGLAFGGPGAGAYLGSGKTLLTPAAATAHGFWLAFVGQLVHAWVWSFFWTAATTAYLLLRRDVDGTPIHQVTLEPDNPSPPPTADVVPIRPPFTPPPPTDAGGPPGQ